MFTLWLRVFDSFHITSHTTSMPAPPFIHRLQFHPNINKRFDDM